eukprot:m.318695 g.318695  ORF g.318695 m.318695 type:complete len:834 (+) comp20290_c0_seq19:99-2600(+)
MSGTAWVWQWKLRMRSPDDDDKAWINLASQDSDAIEDAYVRGLKEKRLEISTDTGSRTYVFVLVSRENIPCHQYATATPNKKRSIRRWPACLVVPQDENQNQFHVSRCEISAVNGIYKRNTSSRFCWGAADQSSFAIVYHESRWYIINTNHGLRLPGEFGAVVLYQSSASCGDVVTPQDSLWAICDGVNDTIEESDIDRRSTLRAKRCSSEYLRVEEDRRRSMVLDRTFASGHHAKMFESHYNRTGRTNTTAQGNRFASALKQVRTDFPATMPKPVAKTSTVDKKPSPVRLSPATMPKNAANTSTVDTKTSPVRLSKSRLEVFGPSKLSSASDTSLTSPNTTRDKAARCHPPVQTQENASSRTTPDAGQSNTQSTAETKPRPTPEGVDDRNRTALMQQPATLKAELELAKIQIAQFKQESRDNEKTSHELRLALLEMEKKLEVEREQWQAYATKMQSFVANMQSTHSAEQGNAAGQLKRLQMRMEDFKAQAESAARMKRVLTKRLEKYKDQGAKSFLIPVDIPAYWRKNLQNLPDNKRVQLDAICDEYQTIKTIIEDPPNDPKEKYRGYFAVTGIERVWDRQLWEKFSYEKKQLMDKYAKFATDGLDEIERKYLPGESCPQDYLSRFPMNTPCLDRDVREYWLFHGSAWHNIDAVLTRYGADGGYDPRVGNLTGLFGGGFYLSDNPRKCWQYIPCPKCGWDPNARTSLRSKKCKCKPEETAYMDYGIIVYRVLVGIPEILKKPDPKGSHRRKPGTYSVGIDPVEFDAVLCDGKYVNRNAVKNDFREVVVYQRHRAYPEYVVRFQRTEEPREKMFNVRRWLDRIKATALNMSFE